MRTRAWIAAAGAVVALSGAAATAPAPARADTIVVESYGGQRPVDASRLLTPVLDELGKAGYQDASRLGPKVEQSVSRGPGAMSADDFAAIARLVDDGYERSFLRSDFNGAVDKLTRAFTALTESPAMLAQDPTRRDLELTALVGLSLAHKRLGHADDAERYMSEIIRSFADRDFNRSKYGPEAHDLYSRLRGELVAHGRGALHVRVDDDAAVIFLNEHFEAVGKLDKGDLLPGTYRVYVQKGSEPGRLHLVTIEAKAEAHLELEWRFEAALHTDKDWVGLGYANAAEQRANERAHALRLGRALGATSVVVLSVEPREGRRAVVGTMLAIDTERPTRSGFVSLEPIEPSPQQLRGLGRFLTSGQIQEGVHPDVGPVAHASEGGGSALRGRRLIGVGVGVGGIVLAGVGGWLALSAKSSYDDAHAPGGGCTADNQCTQAGYDQVKDAQTRGTIATVVVGAGLAAVAAGVVLYLTAPKERAAPRGTRLEVVPSMGAGSAAVLVQGRF
jgi:hypothetical protein